MSTLTLPELYTVIQEKDSPFLPNIPTVLWRELEASRISELIRPGDAVALAVGSRDIADIPLIVKTTADYFRSLGGSPFIVPAMGSHGGGRAEGQSSILHRFGVTEENAGCEIRSSMEVLRIGDTEFGCPVFLDRHAAESNHIVVINRVKPHTRFSGTVESGLVKMCLIGLGKSEGAVAYHQSIARHSWERVWGPAFSIMAEGSPLRLGIAVVENGNRQSTLIKALSPGQFPTAEPALLARARKSMSFIPFHDIDLLIVDEIGKDISGTGMDTNVIGRKEGLASIARLIFVRDLTQKTGGNALGIGLADFTTKHCVEKIDFSALNLNARTAFRTDACKIPMTFGSDRDAIAAALDMAGFSDPAGFRLVWIKNTLDLGSIRVSEALLDEASRLSGLRIAPDRHTIDFDLDGNLILPEYYP